MGKTELKGNQFELSRSHHFTEYGGWVALQPTEVQRQFIGGIREHYIAEGWVLQTALISGLTPDQRFRFLTIVFNHPLKDSLVSKVPTPDFLSSGYIEKAGYLPHVLSSTNYWNLVEKSVNELLRGTEFQAYSISGQYDEVYGNRRLFHWDRPTLYREGIALIDISLQTIENLVQITELSLVSQTAEILKAQRREGVLEEKLTALRLLQSEQSRTLL